MAIDGGGSDKEEYRCFSDVARILSFCGTNGWHYKVGALQSRCYGNERYLAAIAFNAISSINIKLGA